MPRAHRHYVPEQVWHITHRCHEKSFLLRFARDRCRYLRWLFEARKRFGLRILNYVVTSNHVHLLVRDTGEGMLAQSMQLVAGRTAQQYNERKTRHGAFWEDRYHATAIEAGEHLCRCVVYIDLNMVRAGVVAHPAEWQHGGYVEIHNPPERCRLIDLAELSTLCGFATVAEFQDAHRQWVAAALAANVTRRDACWTEALAVGSRAYAEGIKRELGAAALQRDVQELDAAHALREPEHHPYRARLGGKIDGLRPKNQRFWETNIDRSGT